MLCLEATAGLILNGGEIIAESLYTRKIFHAVWVVSGLDTILVLPQIQITLK